ncbi:hypothetical protein VF13_39700 [Nostoc linckia z16]|nr:hypothetical protein VF12_40230 [Nostoc linckia z15]PHK30312.1 hypothetical protein VF13_39700 [Nostoc linckia z16]
MGRKPKVYEPFEKIVEYHPWIRFPEAANQAKNLVIGSFPPNKFTSHREKLTLCDIDFFYGSKENAFWELFVSAKNLTYKIPDDIAEVKHWLIENYWSVTDIVKSAQRKKDTAYDTDLINLSWNIEAIESIFTTNPIRNVYFTSRWVKEKFDIHIKPNLANLPYSGINEFVLLSPSRNGLRSAKKARFTTQKSQESETAGEFRKRYYSFILNA